MVSSGPALGLAWQARGAGGALAVVDACAVSSLTERSINQLKQPFPGGDVVEGRGIWKPTNLPIRNAKGMT